MSSLEELEAEVKRLHGVNDDLCEVIHYVLRECEDGKIEFLDAWFHGEWEQIKREWPDFDGYMGTREDGK